MKRKLIIFIACLLLTIISLVYLLLAIIIRFDNYDIVLSVTSAIIGITIPYNINHFVDLTDSLPWQTYLRRLYRLKLIKRTDRIRISYAYLFRIEVDGEYLLIKNKHGFNKFQPPGHTYVLSLEEKNYLKANFYVTEDDRIKSKKVKNDYRLFVPAYMMKKFYKRFLHQIDVVKTENYQNGFKATLIDSGVLNPVIFENINLRFVRRHIENIKFTKPFKCYEMLLADVFEVVLTQDQIDSIRKLRENKNSDQYEFANEELIKSLGVDTAVGDMYAEIAEHTYKILPVIDEFEL